MTAPQKISKKNSDREPELPRWANLILSLTLVPLIAGVIFIAAWALDIDLTGSLENQLYVGMLLMLLGFIVSNLIQKRWRLFAGWVLLAIADVIFLLFINLYLQAVAMLLAIAGLFFLGMEIYRRMQPDT